MADIDALTFDGGSIGTNPVGWIEVILAAFIDDSYVTISRGVLVGDE